MMPTGRQQGWRSPALVFPHTGLLSSTPVGKDERTPMELSMDGVHQQLGQEMAGLHGWGGARAGHLRCSYLSPP